MDSRYSIKDDRFDISALAQKKLILEFQMDKFVFIVYNHDINCIEWLEDFSINNWAKDLASIYDHHPFLKANFWKEIGIVLHSANKSIIPSEFDGMLKYENFFISKLNKEVEIQSCTLGNWQTLLYPYPQDIHNFITETYVDRDIHLIPNEVCLPNSKNGLVILFYDNWISFNTYDNNNLSNSKTIKIKDAKQFSELLEYFYDQNEVILIGSITNYSPYYHVIKQKAGEVKFGQLSPEIKFTQYFSELPKHKYFTIFNYNYIF